MSFFGFEQNGNLEREKRDFAAGKVSGQGEDLAVFTWGEESYDGLGDALLEGGDELNDETFGGSGAVGKDFDFGQQALPSDDLGTSDKTSSGNKLPTFFGIDSPRGSGTPSLEASAAATSSNLEQQSSRQAHSLWDERSPFSVLPRMNGGLRTPSDLHRTTSSSKLFQQLPNQNQNGSSSLSSAGQMQSEAHASSPGLSSAQLNPQGLKQQSGIRTLEEIEAEMRAAAQRSRTAAVATQRQQLLQEQQQQQQQQYYQQQQRTAPPRMHPQSQSPRFHQQQQQHQLLLQQQREQQLLEQQLREQALRERERERERERQRQLQIQMQEMQLQEQMKLEELERQMRAARLAELRHQEQQQQQQQQVQLLQGQYLQRGATPQQAQALALADLAAQQQQQLVERNRRLRASPALIDPHLQAVYQQQVGAGGGGGAGGPLLPQNIQMQQRLLSELAQAEFLQNMQATTEEEQNALRQEAMRRIMETERMEEKRRRKAAKINHMSRYNDLMTQSDKDFITRIQVSQLVTQDPYAEDFYAQVYGAIIRSRMGMQPTDDRVLKFGSGGGVGLGLGQKGSGRRPNAMQKMEQQVERIVTNARLREKEKGMHSVHSLQGALGKTSGRSYKAAPRQLLQVDSNSANGNTSPSAGHAHISREDAVGKEGEGVAKAAAKIGAEALGTADEADGPVHRDPLTKREALVILESLYDLALNIEQVGREQPDDPDDFEAMGIWEAQRRELITQLFEKLQVMAPLETSTPHPFISLITPAKGKKLLPRISKHFDQQQTLTMLTLLVACFSQMDIVIHASVLDTPLLSSLQTDIDRQTQIFLGSVISTILPVVAKAGLRLVSGLLGLLMERSDIVAIAQTKPGMAFLTIFLSRAELIKQNMAMTVDMSELPTEDEVQQWEHLFNHIFEILLPHLPYLFPSTRIAMNLASLPPSEQAQYASQPIQTDALDQPVWQFFATYALHSSMEQQQLLVTALREKVLENVASAKRGWVQDEEEMVTKLANVNLFLKVLGLHSDQITV